MSLNKIIAFFILFICLPILANNSFLQVDSAKIAYKKGNFKKAISIYESILSNNVESAGIYYNLGNAYFKNNDIGMAILYYEKAKKLNAEDEDLVTNLKIANQRIEDKIDPAPELFLKQWKKSIFDLMNEKQWSVFLIALFAFALFLISLYLISSNKKLKQLGFFGGALFLILSVCIYFIASKKHDEAINSNEAIIVTPSSNVNSSPSEKGTKLFILHEGTKVKIMEENDNYTEIKIANDNVGWIKSAALRKI